MKGHFFGYVQEKPCPECGTSRVGLDYDDDYYIVPGVLHPATSGTPARLEDLPGCPQCPSSAHWLGMGWKD